MLLFRLGKKSCFLSLAVHRKLSFGFCVVLSAFIAFSVPLAAFLFAGALIVFHTLYTLIARMALIIAITDTPTSAKTAAHIFAKPNAASSSTRIFTESAKTIF